MIGDGTYVVMALIRQSARCREYLYNTNHAEEEEHHPDDLVAFEDIAYSLVHFSIYGSYGAYGAYGSYKFLANSLNCSPRSSMFLNRSNDAQQGDSSTVMPGSASS